MDDIAMKLPLRLVPRKTGQVFKILFFGFFFCFAIFWTVAASSMLWAAPIAAEPWPGFTYLFPLFGLPFIIVGVVGLTGAVLKLLPLSPYYHVELRPDGIGTRKLFQRRFFAWGALSPFDIAMKVRRTKGGKVTTYWIVALNAADAPYLADEKQRYNRSVLQINTGEYVNMDVENAATVLADWLNGLRQAALDRPGRAPATTAMPPDFRAAARELGAVRAAPADRSSVIER